MIIKSVAKGPWNERPKTHTTWYEPYHTPATVQDSVNFVLSQDVTGLCMAGDVTVIPMVLQACQQFELMTADEQAALIERGKSMEMIF